MNTIAAVPIELLVLSGQGIRIGLVGHYGLFYEAPTLETAVKAAREKLAAGQARAFVALRIVAKVIDEISQSEIEYAVEARRHGTEREVVRFEVYPDRVALVPSNQGGLSDEQKAKALALPQKGLL